MSKFRYVIVSSDRKQFLVGASRFVNEYPDASLYASAKLAFLFAKDFSLKYPKEMPNILHVVKDYGTENATIVRSIFRQEHLQF